jgi:hypothetical protein
VTLADLHAAWMQRRRGDWPCSFEQVMADPLLGRLVRAEAIGRALAARRFEARQAAATPAALAPLRQHACTSTSPWPARRQQAPIFDRKRAASGEREDD